MNLAQLNIAEWLIPADDPRAAGFMDNLDRINALAERTSGFVWRLKDDSGNATNIDTPWPDNVIANMSVWESAEALENFVWNTVHRQIYKQKHEWFTAMNKPFFVMWWVEQGHLPTLQEAKERLELLRAHGDCDEAFGWSHLPHVKLWQSQACG